MRSKHIIGGLIAVAVVFAGIFCTTFSTVTQSVPLLLLSAAAILAMICSKNTFSSASIGLKVLVVITCLYFLIRAYCSPVVDLARQDMFLIASATMIYCIIGLLMPNETVRKWMIVSFILLMILNFLNWIPAVDQWRDSKLNFANGDRNTGWFNHRNFFGNFMCMMTCLCLSFAIFTRGDNKVKLGSSLLAVMGGVSVILSTSRASFLALVVGIAVIVACWMIINFHSSAKKNKVLKIVMSLGLSLVVVLCLLMGSKYVLNERSTEMSESNGRKNYFALSIEQIPDAPLLGSGSRSIEYKAYEYWPMSMRRNKEDFKFVHNEYLQTITDYGLFGFLLLLVIFFWHIVSGIMLIFTKLNSNDTENIAYLVSGLSIMLSLSVNMLFSFPLHGYVNLILIIFASNMLLGSFHQNHANTQRSKRQKALVLLTLVSLTLTVCYNFVEGRKEFMAGYSFWKEKIMIDDLHWQVEDSIDSGLNWEKALKGAIDYSPTFERYDRLGAILYKKGEYNESYNYYNLSKKRHPYSPISRISLARLLTLKGDFAQAEKEYKDVEYLVKNREPLFMFYRNLAEFYLTWSSVDTKNKSKHLNDAREACKMSVRKTEGHIRDNVRITIERVLLASYYEFLENSKYDEAYEVFDELMGISKAHQVKNENDINYLLSHGKELVKHAQLAWRKGQLERAAKATYRAKMLYFTYHKKVNGEVYESWSDEYKKINQALKIFQRAGVKIDKK